MTSLSEDPDSLDTCPVLGISPGVAIGGPELML
jgi:hypothetical protein